MSMEDQNESTIKELSDETTVVRPEEGKSRIFFIVLTLVILVFGGLVGYYIIQQQNFLDEEIDRLVLTDQDRMERKVIRSLQEKLSSIEKVFESEDWNTAQIADLAIITYPVEWHVLSEQAGEASYTIALDPDPIARYEGGHYDAVTTSIRPINPDVVEIHSETTVTSPSGNLYGVDRVAQEEGDPWYTAREVYTGYLQDDEGNAFVVEQTVLTNHPAFEEMDTSSLINLLEIFLVPQEQVDQE